MVIIRQQRNIIVAFRFVPIDDRTIRDTVDKSIESLQSRMVQRVDTPYNRVGYADRRTRHIGIGRTAYTIQLVVDNRIIDNRGLIVYTNTAPVIIVNDIVENDSCFGIDTASISEPVATECRIGYQHRVIDKTRLGVRTAILMHINGSSFRGKIKIEQASLYAATDTVERYTSAAPRITVSIGRAPDNSYPVEHHVHTRRIESNYRMEIVCPGGILGRVERREHVIRTDYIVSQSVAR